MKTKMTATEALKRLMRPFAKILGDYVDDEAERNVAAMTIVREAELERASVRFRGPIDEIRALGVVFASATSRIAFRTRRRNNPRTFDGDTPCWTVGRDAIAGGELAKALRLPTMSAEEAENLITQLVRPIYFYSGQFVDDFDVDGRLHWTPGEGGMTLSLWHDGPKSGRHKHAFFEPLRKKE